MADPVRIPPDEPCYAVLADGRLCGHPFTRHFGGGPCLAITASGEASVCACLNFVRKGE
jgi:hypothetical protein